MTTKISINDLLNIPRRMEPLGGQNYSYILLEEAAYLFETILNERDTLAAELDKVKAERDRLQKRIDSGIRARTSKAHYDYSDQLIWANNEDDDKYNNSTIILDEGVKL